MPTALITGASLGIGHCFAEQLAAQGHDLVLVARSADRLETLAREISAAHGVNVECISADLSTSEGTEQVERRIAEGEPLDLVINNAGYATRGPVAQLDLPALEEMLRVNILALVRLSHAALRRMLEQGRGTIINIASGTAFIQMPGNAGYGSSKAFVVAFTRHMHVETRDTGVQVQLLVPGVIDTPFHERAGTSVANFPPHMVMQPDDLVRASLKAVELGETVCIPSMPELGDWEAYVAAEAKVLSNVSRSEIAERYR